MPAASQMPDATHVVGFHTWKQMGRFVKKGEKGIVIIAPMVLRRQDEQAKDGDTPESILRFRGVTSSTCRRPTASRCPSRPASAATPAPASTACARSFAGRGITADSADVPPDALGVSRGGRISICSGLESAVEFSVTAHEFAHELLHRGEDRPASKTVRETEAEAVAFVVCQAIGLQIGTAASDYIQLFDGKTETLAQSLDRIQHVAAEIIAALLGTPDEQAQAP